jgi:hypothetical protein
MSENLRACVVPGKPEANKPTAEGDNIMDAQVQMPKASETLESKSSSNALPEEQAGHIPCPACRGGEFLDTLKSWIDPS